MAFDVFPPSGIDRATGTDGFPGTPTPAGALINTSPVNFEEFPTSPDIERGEQATIVHTFNCDQNTGLALITGIGRGFLQEDSSGNVTRVLSARLTQTRGNQCTFQTTSEGLNFDVPPDEYGVDVLEFNPDLCRQPTFLPITQYVGFAADGQTQVFGPQLISLIKTAAQQLQLDVQTDGMAPITSGFLVTNPTIQALCVELFNKYLQGEETFYLAGFKVTYSSFYWSPPYMNPGSYLEDPVASGILPAYFWSIDQTPTGQNSLTYLASIIAPQYYANGFSSLRLSDSLGYQRTWFKLTSQWILAPYGHWDADIYNGQ